MPIKRAVLVFEGDSLRVLTAFPEAVKITLGYALHLVQIGEEPPDSKPMTSVGAGVFELRESDERAWYRVIYLKKIADKVHVLHCFEKKTGKTGKKELDTARERLKRVQAWMQEERKSAQKEK